jgi:hypothetical protein
VYSWRVTKNQEGQEQRMKLRIGRLALVFALVSSLLAVGDAGRAAPETVPSCDLAGRVAERLAELGETGKSTWTIDPVSNDTYLGMVPAADTVRLSPSIPCDKIFDVVNHEWMHLLQEREYPGRVQRAYGGYEQFELVADCGSKILGSDYTPYETRIHACSSKEFESAARLIEQSEMAAVPAR